MKTKLQFVAATVLAAASLSAFASTGAHTYLSGDPVPATPVMIKSEPAVSRVVNIASDTKYVNVKAGDTVKFVAANGQSAIWAFDNPQTSEVKLRKIMPAGSLDHKVMVYVARNPDFRTN